MKFRTTIRRNGEQASQTTQGSGTRCYGSKEDLELVRFLMCELTTGVHLACRTVTDIGCFALA
jgi:hypothetical protein